MKIVLPIVFLISINLFGVQTESSQQKKTEIDINKYLKKSDEWKKELSEIMNKKNTTIDNKKYLEMMDTGKDGTFMGKKLPTMKFPERKTEIIDDPLKRAELVDSKLIQKQTDDLNSKSKNIAKLYKFLATYGISPRKDGNLENEKELYKLIESGELKLTSKKVKIPESKIKPINHFMKLGS